jgi:cbb3-type cytochrome oxidase maturation protein
VDDQPKTITRMNIIIILIGISLVIALVFLGVFFWAIKSGQFDDTYTPSVRILFEDKKKEKADKTKG